MDRATVPCDLCALLRELLGFEKPQIQTCRPAPHDWALRAVPVTAAVPLREKGLIVVPFEGHHGREGVGAGGGETAVRIPSTIRKPRTMNTTGQLFLLCIQFGVQAQGMVPPTFRVGPPTSVHLSK